ncbi:MAG TPA: hypothetical protein V6C76_14255 [Drouetiella sp.]
MKTTLAQKIQLGLSLMALATLTSPATFADKVAAAPAEPKASGDKVSAWVLSVNSNFAGTLSYTITQNAVRVKFDKLGLVMLIKAPKWNALVYNESNKNYCDLPYDHWKAKFLLRGKRVSDKAVTMKPVTTGKSEVIQGFKCYQVIVKRKNIKTNVEETMADAWIAKDIKAPPQFNSMMKTMLDIPVDSGTPLRVFQMAKNSTKLVQVFECFKAKKTEVPTSDFEPLTGYKKVKDEMAMMLDEGDDTGAGMDDESLDSVTKPPVKPATPPPPAKKSGGGFFDIFKGH